MSQSHNLLLLILSSAPIVQGEIKGLTTDFSGNLLYFASTHGVRGQSEDPHSKIFRWDRERGIRVHLMRPKTIVNEGRTNYYDLDSPYISRDGTRLAFVGHQDCTSCLAFRNPRTAEVSVVDENGATLFQRFEREVAEDYVSAELSANGQYVIRWTFPLGWEGAFYLVKDPQTAAGGTAGGISGFRNPPAAYRSRQAVTDDGKAVLVDQDNFLFLATSLFPRDNTPLPVWRKALAPAISASGRVAVYESLFEDGQRRALYSLDINTGAEYLLFGDREVERVGRLPTGTVNPYFSFYLPPYRVEPRPLFDASIDDEGWHVLALARESPSLPRQWLFVINYDGSDPRWMAYTPEGYRETVISGDGRIAFAVTQSGRLVRVRIGDGEVEELLPATPWVAEVQGAAWRGAANRIVGGGFVTQTFVPESYPAPASLGGVRVEFNGRPVLMLSVSPNEIVYQLPWDLPETIADLPDFPLRLLLNSDSPLLLPDLPPIKRTFPRPLTLNQRPIVIESPGALREDGTAVSLVNPIQPGEILRIFLTGYDEPRGAEGVPAPDPPTPGVAKHDCVSIPALEPQDILYFGLAPGKIGVYELRFRVPSNIRETATEGYLSVGCRQSGGINLPVAR